MDVDNFHGAFSLHKREQDALPVLDQYALIIVDESSQLPRMNSVAHVALQVVL